MRLKISYHLLHTNGVFNNLLLALLGLDTHLEHLVDYLFEIFNHVIVLSLEIFVCLVNDAYEDFSIVLEGAPERL